MTERIYLKAIHPKPVPDVNGLDPNCIYATDAHGTLFKVGFRKPIGRPVGWRKNKEPQEEKNNEQTDA